MKPGRVSSDLDISDLLKEGITLKCMRHFCLPRTSKLAESPLHAPCLTVPHREHKPEL